MEEVWMQITDYPYKVSSLGRVMRDNGGKAKRNGRIMKPQKIRHGYLAVCLCKNNVKKTITIAKLVCTAFHGPKPSPLHHAAHENGDNTNNSASNLSWKLPKENEADKVRHGTKIQGIDHKLAKLTEENVRHIRKLIAMGFSLRSIAERFNISDGKISHIKSGLSWKHVT